MSNLNDLPDAARLTVETPLLDFSAPTIQSLVREWRWRELGTHDRIGVAYTFVRDEIAFGYNESDDLPASRVMVDGIGQCNTKGTLLMALLRALEVPCRFHGFTIDKALQEGAITGLAYMLAPQSIIHSWVEVWYEGRWVNLEGFILDQAYLTALQKKFSDHRGPFCGFGAATPDLQRPRVDWCGTDTYIQKDGINHDFGVFDAPDEFYAKYGANLSGFKRLLFRGVARHWMNRTVARTRRGG